jgi:hypothetical protein
MERNKLSIIIAFAVDIILVLTMFVGLLRLRGRARGVFGLARLLWKQVRPSVTVVTNGSPGCFSIAIMYFPFARALFGSCLPQELGSSQR